MQTYLELAEFCKLVHLNEDAVKGMIANGSLNFKEENGTIYIEANQGTFSVVPSGTSEAAPISSISLAGESFVEKTIGTILNLHEKVLDAKDETLDTLKNENKFLKDALYSMQEIYDEDRKTIDILNEQLARAQEEVEFLKRKYKLMWNKAVDNFTQGKEKVSFEEDELKDEPNLNASAQNTTAQGAANSAASASAINTAKAAQSVANAATPKPAPSLNSGEKTNATPNSGATNASAMNSAPSTTANPAPNSNTTANLGANSNIANTNSNVNSNATLRANTTQNSATPNAAPSATSSASGVSNPNLNATSSANSTLNSATSGAKQ